MCAQVAWRSVVKRREQQTRVRSSSVHVRVRGVLAEQRGRGPAARRLAQKLASRMARACVARSKPAALLLLLAALLCVAQVAAKPRVRVGSDLDGVPDSEEDDAWREWGKRREPKKIEGKRGVATAGGWGRDDDAAGRRADAGGAQEGILEGAYVFCVGRCRTPADVWRASRSCS